jgi:hypothetical protein
MLVGFTLIPPSTPFNHTILASESTQRTQEILHDSLTPPPSTQPTEPVPVPRINYTPEAFARVVTRLTEIQGPFIPSINQPTPPLSPLLTVSHPLEDEEPSMSTVFIGLRRDSKSLRCSYLERNVPLVTGPSVGIILQSIMTRELSPAGRALNKWPMDVKTWVSTSRMPIDIENDDYSRYSAHFYDVGVLGDILCAVCDSPIITPAPQSTTLDTFITEMALPKDQPVFVIYVYTEVTISYLSSPFHFDEKPS